MTKSVSLERAGFALVAVAFCLLLSFRPIPAIFSENDTGRYVACLYQYCSGLIDTGFFPKYLSYRIFYAVTQPACWVESEGLFLLEAALFLPLGLLLFARWHKGTFLWASALLFSVFGIELMTNAMRQGLGLFFFFGAVALIHSHRTKALLLGLLAVAAHASALAFYPLLIWMASSRLSKGRLLVFGGVVLMVIFECVMILEIPVFEFIRRGDELHTFYSFIYARVLKTSFMLFMVLPLFFVYGIRFLRDREHVTGDERKAFIYSIVLLIMIYIHYPYVTFRFAIFSLALQIFLITRSERPGAATGGYAVVGLLVHLSFMLMATNHFEVFIHG
jgi:hypothetical protein